MATKKKTINFEDSLSTLDELVSKMENESLGLEEALDCFEQGIALTKDCQKALSSAEKKVNTLMAKSDFGDDQPNDE